MVFFKYRVYTIPLEIMASAIRGSMQIMKLIPSRAFRANCCSQSTQHKRQLSRRNYAYHSQRFFEKPSSLQNAEVALTSFRLLHPESFCGFLFHSVSPETKTGTRNETKQTSPLFSTRIARPLGMMKHILECRHSAASKLRIVAVKLALWQNGRI